jgi:hypothetical protein
MFNPFRSYAHRHWQNLEGSGLTHARAGIFETPSGGEEPAVVIFRDRHCLAVLTTEDATRIADQIIDAVETPVVRKTP